MKYRPHRIAARAIIMQDAKLLMVNAFPDGQSDLWCAPGGGVEPGSSLPDNLRREIYEETGLTVHVGAPCLVNEFHDPDHGVHQIDLFFRCTIVSGQIDPKWVDPENVVTTRRFFSRADMQSIRFKPDSLADVAWGAGNASYDALETLVR